MKDQSQYQQIIANVCKELKNSFGLYPIIGAEVEFYLLGNPDPAPLLEKIHQQDLKLGKEKGANQHEFVLAHTPNLLKLAEKIIDLRNFITFEAKNHAMEASFAAKPIANNYGSALHLHLSLHDENGKNVFLESSYNENIWLQHVIGGLLDMASESTNLLCTSEKDYDRFVPKFMAPTTVSWGGNNRTTIIRIPDSKPEHRRIEYRLAPANCCPYALTAVLLVGTLHGLQNKIRPPERIHGIADDIQYNLKTLPKSLEEAKKTFHERKVLLGYLDKLGN